MGIRKELPSENESPKSRICRAARFIFSPFVGRKDESSINYQMQGIEESAFFIREQGEDPAELIDVVEETIKNSGGLSHYKQGIAGSILNILLGKGPQRFP